MTTILQTENEVWGFWGTMSGHAPEAWGRTFAAIVDAADGEPDAVRAYLDSRPGRDSQTRCIAWPT